MLDHLPEEWIVGLAQEWLNPREQRRLASCSQRLYLLLPQPLRIRICSSRSLFNATVNNSNNVDGGCCCLDGDLFVSRVIIEKDEEEEEDDGRKIGAKPMTATSLTTDDTTLSDPTVNKTSVSAPLSATKPQELQFDTMYYLWKFDYQAQCRLYLGRQLRQTFPRTQQQQQEQQQEGNNENNHENIENTTTTTSKPLENRYTLGFRPYRPNQYWKIVALEDGDNNDSYRNHEEQQEKFQKDFPVWSSTSMKRSVLPGRPVQFVVAGWDPRAGQIDSVEVHQLKAQVRPTHSGRPTWKWYTMPGPSSTPENVKNKSKQNQEEEQQHMDQDYYHHHHHHNNNNNTTTTTTTRDLSFTYTTTSHLHRRMGGRLRGRRPALPLSSFRSEGDALFVLFPSCPQLVQQRYNNHSTSATTAAATATAAATKSQQQEQQHRRRRIKRCTTTTVATQRYEVNTFAIPDIDDRGFYLLYSPQQWWGKNHNNSSAWVPYNSNQPHGGLTVDNESSTTTTRTSTAGPINHDDVITIPTINPPVPRTTRLSNGRSAIVDFVFWTVQGMLYFKAYWLPITLAIPIVTLDREYFLQSSFKDPPLINNFASRPIKHLFDSYSARWGCIKYYMATAADVGEGCTFQLETFLRGVTDHKEHVVEHDADTNIVTIVMKVKQEDTNEERVVPVDASLVPEIQRDDSRPWKFFFSW